jgi:hypothetical protein
MERCYGSDLAVCKIDIVSIRHCPVIDLRELSRCQGVEAEDRASKSLSTDFIGDPVKRLLSFPLGQPFDAADKLCQADRGKIQIVDRLSINPTDYFRVWSRPHRLRDDVDVKNDHSNVAPRTGVMSRVMSRSTPPNSRVLS